MESFPDSATRMNTLLDNNVLSEIGKPAAARLAFLNIVEWLVPAPDIAEIQEGAEASPSAARRIEINSRLDVFFTPPCQEV
jgi:predicted nucleic acid-binding protein